MPSRRGTRRRPLLRQGVKSGQYFNISYLCTAGVVRANRTPEEMSPALAAPPSWATETASCIVKRTRRIVSYRVVPCRIESYCIGSFCAESYRVSSIVHRVRPAQIHNSTGKRPSMEHGERDTTKQTATHRKSARFKSTESISTQPAQQEIHMQFGSTKVAPSHASASAVKPTGSNAHQPNSTKRSSTHHDAQRTTTHGCRMYKRNTSHHTISHRSS